MTDWADIVPDYNKIERTYPVFQKTKSCFRCVHWHVLSKRDYTKGMSGFGQCRINPPECSGFPKTACHEHCGSFKRLHGNPRISRAEPVKL